MKTVEFVDVKSEFTRIGFGRGHIYEFLQMCETIKTLMFIVILSLFLCCITGCNHIPVEENEHQDIYKAKEYAQNLFEENMPEDYTIVHATSSVGKDPDDNIYQILFRYTTSEKKGDNYYLYKILVDETNISVIEEGAAQSPFLESTEEEKHYTYKELMEMPASKLYQLFLDEGLELPDEYKTITKEEMADHLKSGFDMLRQGFTAASATVHHDFAKSVKEVYDRITYPPATKVIEYIELDKEHEEAGYVIEINTTKIPLNEITGQINEVKEILIDQHANHDLFSSTSPGYWKKDFSTSAEEIEYIGLKNLHGLDGDYEEQNVAVTVYGNDKGELEYLNLETWYEIGELRLQAMTRIYTEKYEEELTTSFYTTEDIEFYDSYLSTEKYSLVHTIGSTPTESGHVMHDGFLVRGDILYSLHIVSSEKDAQKAMEVLLQWAALFDEL